MSKTLQDLRFHANLLREQIAEIEAKERAVESRKLVGKCFIYKNCYSCPNGPEDYWNMYQRVVRVTHDGNIQVFSFQADKDGAISVETRIRMAGGFLGEPISTAKFRAAWKAMQKRIAATGAAGFV